MSVVIKRDGRTQVVSFDKITHRIHSLSEGLAVNPIRVAQVVVQGVTDGVHTSELDELASESAAALATHHPDYSRLAARISVSNLQKKTEPSMRSVLRMLSPEVRSICEDHMQVIDATLNFERDFRFDIFGFATLHKSYLLRDESGKVVERPQVMYMRIALGIHGEDLSSAFETYELMSTGVMTHATPTMFNAGTSFHHLASCFLLPISTDSIEGIFRTLTDCAMISKSAGGIGFSVSNVRAEGSKIHSTGGTSSGLVKMLKVFESTARYVDQGGGKRKGAFAAYIEPWHADIFAFLDMKKNHGAEELRARDLFYALWIPDLFMRRVEANMHWTLLCPSDCPDLVDLHSDDFEAKYVEYERTVPRRTVKAQDLWGAIIDSQIETGTPYMLYKDACNRKSNQKNWGTIRSSNLCTEIVQFSSEKEIAVCNLASIALQTFVTRHVDNDELFYDHDALARVVRVVTRNLNRVIDRNLYSRPEARASNTTHRPIGIGVNGLADAFVMLGLPYESPAARSLNHDIFETIYYASLDASCELARTDGSYQSFEGSPASRGELQFDLWGVQPPKTSRWDWTALKEKIRVHKLRNSLLVAPMPTASTAQILGNNECFEPFTSNIYKRSVNAGEFTVINKYLVKSLECLNLWDDGMRRAIIAGNGSVQHIDAIPSYIKALFKTAWEMKMRSIIDLAADRGPYIDQSQSLNLFMANPSHSKITSMHFHGWKRGLKTGMYYLRTKAAADPVKPTLTVDEVRAAESCRREPPEECTSCSA